MSQEILYEVHDGVGRVTFNRPEARNALTFRMYDRVGEILQQAEKDSALRAVIFTGAGDKAFAAGTDISEFRAFSSPEDALGYEARMDRILDALERSPIPTIAAIAGACTGGGAALAACCDIRIGAQNTRFGMPIARTLGNCLSIANYVRLASLIGPARVKDIIFTGRLVEAAEAHAVGLLAEVLPDYTTLQNRANELAQIVAAQAPLTLRATKEALRRVKEHMAPQDDRDLILMCYMSRDFREGLDAFLKKRAPKWTGA